MERVGEDRGHLAIVHSEGDGNIYVLRKTVEITALLTCAVRYNATTGFSVNRQDRNYKIEKDVVSRDLEIELLCIHGN